MKNVFRTALVMLGLIGTMSFAVPAQPAFADCDAYILTFPAWYNGLTTGSGDNCTIDSPSQDADGAGIEKFATKVILNLIDILMQLVAYASIVYLMIGGFRYLTSTGSPDGMATAKKTILNAIIGLIVGMLAVAIVNLVSSSI